MNRLDQVVDIILANLLLLHDEVLVAAGSPLSPPKSVQPLTDPRQTEAEALPVQP